MRWTKDQGCVILKFGSIKRSSINRKSYINCDSISLQVHSNTYPILYCGRVNSSCISWVSKILSVVIWRPLQVTSDVGISLPLHVKGILLLVDKSLIFPSTRLFGVKTHFAKGE
ncbi:unnamed protein product [Blepharisma stoltei]|uniref:Uncharacterized protein n=1 Tax=Blepharisma stoltei TaxID=1481888 RepID=A0AAU9J9J5_9CILI|nr:unnamed protein product [Blepharisma stoltei]